MDCMPAPQAMAAARASASRSMSAWVCTSVTHTSADWPSVRECAREVERAVDACRGEGAVDLGDGPARAVEVDDELLEERRSERGRADARKLAEALGGVLASLHDRGAELAHPVRPEQCEMDGHADRPEALRGAGEVARLTALHVRHAVPAHLAEAPFVVDGAARRRPGTSGTRPRSARRRHWR